MRFRLKQIVFYQVLENRIEYDFIKKFFTNRYIIGKQTKNCLKLDFSFFLDEDEMILLYVRVKPVLRQFLNIVERVLDIE